MWSGGKSVPLGRPPRPAPVETDDPGGFDVQILIVLRYRSCGRRGGVRTINLSMGARKHLRLQQLQMQIDWVPEYCRAGGGSTSSALRSAAIRCLPHHRAE